MRDLQSQDEGGIRENGDTVKKPSGFTQEEKMIVTEIEKEIPMHVSLPIEVMSPDQAFPFLNTTLADLGIDE